MLNEKKRRSLKEYRKRFGVVFFLFKLILLQFNRRTIFFVRSFVGNRILSVQYRIHLFSCNYFVCLRTLFPYILLVQPTWLLYTWNMTRIYALANNSTSQCVPFYHFKRWPYNALRMQLMVIFNSSFSAHSFARYLLFSQIYLIRFGCGVVHVFNLLQIIKLMSLAFWPYLDLFISI